MAKRLAAMGLAAVAVGCTSTRTYTLSVKNATARPLTVCLTKVHGPAEPGWESPEQVAGPGYPSENEQAPGAVIQPGHVGGEGPIPGEFYVSGDGAVLRVYAGTPTLNQMNAMSPGSLDRLDVHLHEGLNAMVISDGNDGRMHVAPAAEAAPTTRPTGG
jgi:hypothetical protein